MQKQKEQLPELEATFKQWLEQRLLAGLETVSRKGDSKWDKKRLHASDVGAVHGGCPRQLKLRLLGHEGIYTTGERWRFWKGHQIEALVRHLLQRLTMQQEEELDKDTKDLTIKKIIFSPPAEDSINDITGTGDFLFKGYWGDKDLNVIVDCKAVRGKKFEYLDKYGANDSHIAQLQRYMAVLDCKFGFLLYIDTEGSNWIRIMHVPRDDKADAERVKQIQEIERSSELPPILKAKVRKLKQKSKKNLNPEKEVQVYMKDSWYLIEQPWNCGYCPYHRRDWLSERACQGALEHWLEKYNKGKEAK